MKASEAYRLSIHGEINRQHDRKIQILNRIESAANKGIYCILVDRYDINSREEEYLKELGYKITEYESSVSGLVHVSWEHETDNR